MSVSSTAVIVGILGIMFSSASPGEARFSPKDGALSLERTTVSTSGGALTRYAVHLAAQSSGGGAPEWTLENATFLPQVPDSPDYTGWIHTGTGGIFLTKSEPMQAADRFDVRSGTWRALPPLPIAPRDGMSFAAWDGKVYGFGGFYRDRISDDPGSVVFDGYAEDVWIYDPATDIWRTAAAPMSSPLLSPFPVTVGDKIYVLGGHYVATRPFGYAGPMRRYDPLLDQWEIGSFGLPDNEIGNFTYYAWQPTLAFGERILILRTLSSDAELSVRVYDPASATVQDLDSPVSQYYFASAEVDGTVYLFGAADNSMLAYNLGTDSWETLPPSPDRLSQSAVGMALDGELYVFDILYQRALVNVYNPAKRSWRRHYTLSLQQTRGADAVFDPVSNTVRIPVLEAGTREMPLRYSVDLQLVPDSVPPRFQPARITPLPPYAPPRFYPAAGVVHKDAVYLLGGHRSYRSDGALRAVQRFDTHSYHWHNTAGLPFARRSAAAVATAEGIYIIGGTTDGSDALSRVNVFTPATGAWRDAADLPGPRREPAAAVTDGIIYAGGGQNATGEFLADFHVYDPARDTWETAPALPEPRAGGSLAVLDGVLYYSGGRAPGGPDNVGEARTDVFRLAPGSAEWQAAAPLPGPAFGHFSTAFADELYLTGGRASYRSEDYTGLWIYTPAADSWRNATPTLDLTPFDSAGLFATAGGLYLAGVDDYTMPGTPPRLLRYTAEAWEPVYLPLTTTGSAGVEYQAQVENSGWGEWVRDGQTAGTTGQSLRLESLRLVLRDLPQCGLRYRVFSPSQGWSAWVRDGQTAAGVPGEQLQALQISLEDSHCGDFSIKYRVHVQNEGWLEWVYDGMSAGTEHSGKRIEAVEVQVW